MPVWEGKGIADGKGDGKYQSGPKVQSALKLTTRPINRSADYRTGRIAEFATTKPPPLPRIKREIHPEVIVPEPPKTSQALAPIKVWEPPKGQTVRHPPRMPGVPKRKGNLVVEATSVIPTTAQTASVGVPDQPPTLGSVFVAERDYKSQIDKIVVPNKGTEIVRHLGGQWTEPSKSSSLPASLVNKAIDKGLDYIMSKYGRGGDEDHMIPPTNEDLAKSRAELDAYYKNRAAYWD
jgi:hypothetical protein